MKNRLLINNGDSQLRAGYKDAEGNVTLDACSHGMAGLAKVNENSAMMLIAHLEAEFNLNKEK